MQGMLCDPRHGGCANIRPRNCFLATPKSSPNPKAVCIYCTTSDPDLNSDNGNGAEDDDNREGGQLPTDVYDTPDGQDLCFCRSAEHDETHADRAMASRNFRLREPAVANSHGSEHFRARRIASCDECYEKEVDQKLSTCSSIFAPILLSPHHASSKPHNAAIGVGCAPIRVASCAREYEASSTEGLSLSSSYDEYTILLIGRSVDTPPGWSSHGNCVSRLVVPQGDDGSVVNKPGSLDGLYLDYYSVHNNLHTAVKAGPGLPAVDGGLGVNVVADGLEHDLDKEAGGSEHTYVSVSRGGSGINSAYRGSARYLVEFQFTVEVRDKRL
ncbi:uncharacterized protein B0I36DRAFT_351546 [Microdochium trichocladiopsis]|uniref:Uncharacterized protein n=1 Tax=Microdochium trichocladiopsis TaxID=1682393 RepID=A0A9P8Y2R7_9PEZI|nr:uncharacterized protein B0I36DRAFT_351546 [Microdochium trichocladiopsis]KAH7028125.1 hypothetical protein B0I36DRAFT_351546 [Microdochium trichocladiopsis]